MSAQARNMLKAGIEFIQPELRRAGAPEQRLRLRAPNI
jgi:hypothetical protein